MERDTSYSLTHLDLDSLAENIRKKIPTLLPEKESGYPAFHAPEIFQQALLDKNSTSPDFSFFALEQLLEEAATLISRCAESRELKLDLESKALDFWLDAESMEAQELVKRKQIAAGEFSLPGEINKLEVKLHETSEKCFNEAKKCRKTAEDIRNDGNSVERERVKLSGAVASLSAFTNFPQVRQAAEDLAKNTMQYELVSAQADTHSTTPSAILHSKMKEIAESKLKYEAVNQNARNELFEIESDSRKKRISLASQPGIGMNFRERMRENQALFERDFRSAYYRIIAASKGFESILGIPAPPPTSNASLSECIIWIRDRAEELARLSEREIITCVSFSVRTLCGIQEWDKGMATGTLSFNVLASHFGNLKCVRLRSVRSFVKANAQGAWCIEFHLPAQAEIIRPDGTTLKLSQDNSGPLWFGSVTTRGYGKKDASCGGRSIIGRSLLGKWDVTISQHSDEGEPLSFLDDIKIEFDISAYR
ncbi:hypothetical protein [Pseudomonas lini]|nr:hypothetical protein [Pseudomonas lini]